MAIEKIHQEQLIDPELAGLPEEMVLADHADVSGTPPPVKAAETAELKKRFAEDNPYSK